MTFHYCPGVLGGDTYDGYIFFSLLPGCSWRGHLRWVHILFTTAWVFLEGAPTMGTYSFHYRLGVLGGGTYDGGQTRKFLVVTRPRERSQIQQSTRKHFRVVRKKGVLHKKWLLGQNVESEHINCLKYPLRHSECRGQTRKFLDNEMIAQITIRSKSKDNDNDEENEFILTNGSQIVKMLFVDGDIRTGDSTGVSASLDGEIFSGGKKCQESNIVPTVVALIPTDLTGLPFSTPADQDAPSLSTSPNPQASQSPVAYPDVVEEFHDIEIEADDQAIQTILLGLPEDIYAAVDSCKTAQEIWLRVQQMMKGSDI
nr:ribonuclease H-like domain-containing protein [Tanacetum cinerariifolium]